MAVSIHPTAIVDKGAELADGVEIGPFCVVSGKARLDVGVRLVSHVSVAGSTTIGPRTQVFPFAALGHPPQDTKYKGEDTKLIIGADNLIRESATFHLGTVQGRGETVIGSRGFFMNGAHIGHDNIVGNNVIYATHAVSGGLATINDFVILGGNSAIHQLGRIGVGGFIGGCAPVVGDVIPFGMVDHHGHLNGLNIVGLKRRGATRETIHMLRAVYRELFYGEGFFEDRLEMVAERYAAVPEVMHIVDFIRVGEKRPLCTPRAS
ncbi:MAG: acyl-ACP--UDP-N-acetylglucosamine O-acyltransferase [Hyphomonadaceae bacterium]|jgi:UDP-N-acetylglucosamine acyltransferase|nr:acyl-ACP--UDP-N-acetylglucosamine O-acyltransferase [Hyphomonadaceae bacterium]MBP9234425.1 acyl-ACP--UDP-N-acetylglucosamine O-acyltransferase [Hyphomonadaceae bacterium]